MFNKLKTKAGQPLTYGWLWKCYAYEVIAAVVIYGGMYLYGAYLERKAIKAKAADDITVDYYKFERD